LVHQVLRFRILLYGPSHVIPLAQHLRYHTATLPAVWSVFWQRTGLMREKSHLCARQRLGLRQSSGAFCSQPRTFLAQAAIDKEGPSNEHSRIDTRAPEPRQGWHICSKRPHHLLLSFCFSAARIRWISAEPDLSKP